MRLHEININNFRKLKNCCIKFRDTTFLIGPNNAGKSSVFSALQYLHKNSNIDREDFSKEYSADEEGYVYANEVEIVAEYRNLPAEAYSWLGFKGRVINVQERLDGDSGNSIIYKKVWSLNQSKPRIYMKEYPRVRSDRYSECSKVSDLVGEDYSEEFLKSHFGEANFDKSLTVSATKSKFDDLPECWDVQLDQEPAWVENPGGIPGNVLSKLPRVVLIPAESCIFELTGPGGALLTLLGDLFDQVRRESENYSQAQQFLSNLAAELDPNDGETDFGRLMNELNGMVGNLFPESSVHVNASLDVPEKSIKPQFSVEMESNVKTAVNYQGHGMIRATAFQLLRYVQEFINRNSDNPRATIFCFEEPEIYLHPAAANQMRDSLYELAGDGCQIVATTHSPYMVNLASDRSVSLTKFSLTNTNFSTSSSFNLEDAFLSLQSDEKQNLKMLLKVDDYVSRMFFTKKSIFVEGDTEEVAIRETIKRLTAEDKAKVVGNCEFLRARGKGVMISIAKYLNALELNYILMHDRDRGVHRAEAMNAPILAETGEGRRVMIEECIENLLGYDAPSREKPYRAYEHIQNNWPDNFEDLPSNWKSIFIRLCSPYLDHLEAFPS
ncbi:AAA family ATPase [Thalassolituus sp. ST750PaO-4]|uniref:ATP-dependent nuclease n=1 Tax=Thalassolituus sp. ST750PaO-4 TaxID=2742965 RepID=UPI001CE2B29D|nr:AAA family ATPase [Thalassolituus sp. ST750PaO-4]MCA6058165.1 AAA family ATPase [Thalassolituus sp. ST750PaO-4]